MHPVLISKFTNNRKLLTILLLGAAIPSFTIMVTYDGITGIVAGLISCVCFYTLTKIVK